MNHRLANLAKIKAELAVDSYLEYDDPRMMAEGMLIVGGSSGYNLTLSV